MSGQQSDKAKGSPNSLQDKLKRPGNPTYNALTKGKVGGPGTESGPAPSGPAPRALAPRAARHPAPWHPAPWCPVRLDALASPRPTVALSARAKGGAERRSARDVGTREPAQSHRVGPTAAVQAPRKAAARARSRRRGTAQSRWPLHRAEPRERPGVVRRGHGCVPSTRHGGGAGSRRSRAGQRRAPGEASSAGARTSIGQSKKGMEERNGAMSFPWPRGNNGRERREREKMKKEASGCFSQMGNGCVRSKQRK